MTGSGRGCEKGVEKGARSWQLATGHGQGQSTVDTRAERRVWVREGPATVREDELAFQLLCRIFASNPR